MTVRELVRLSGVFALAGCATAPACRPVGITVAAKDQRMTVRQEAAGLTTTESGHVREAYRDLLVREYWLRDAGGQWYRVDELAWRGAEIGRPANVCR